MGPISSDTGVNNAQCIMGAGKKEDPLIHQVSVQMPHSLQRPFWPSAHPIPSPLELLSIELHWPHTALFISIFYSTYSFLPRLQIFMHMFYLLYFFLKLFIFIYLWLCWVFVSVRGLSLVAASGGHSSLRCAGLSLSPPLLLQSTGSGRAGSVVVAHGPSCSAACGILPDQGSNPCPLH